MAQLARVWDRTVVALGGVVQRASSFGEILESAYAEPHRRYHTANHILAVLEAGSVLARGLELGGHERALLDAAICAHDIICDGVPGQDEANSALWAKESLTACGVDTADADMVSRAVLATAGHLGSPGEPVADCLLDADLSILGASPEVYDRYVLAVRAEYAVLDDLAWRAGRRVVLENLRARSPLYRTAIARSQWETAAKRNMAAEMASLG